MKPIYKTIKITAMHCSICEEPLSGDGSIVTPYTCQCGTWEYDYKIQEFKIKV